MIYLSVCVVFNFSHQCLLVFRVQQKRRKDERRAEQKRLAKKQKADFAERIAEDEKRGFKFSKDKRTLLKAPLDVTAYTIPHGVTGIGKEAFLRCYKLTSIKITDSVTSIGDGAFFLCSRLTSVTIPNSVTRIGNGTFSQCKKLTSVTIPNSVTRIGQGAFAGCSDLRSITIPASVTYIGKWAFAFCSNLTAITIPGRVASIREGTFYKCEKLTSVTLPDSVSSIEDVAFKLCYKLTSITLPDNLTSIGEWAFMSCFDLKSITIPKSVKSIGHEAFDLAGCSKQIYQNYPHLKKLRDSVSDRLRTKKSLHHKKQKSKKQKNKKAKKPPTTPTLEENLTPAQIDRKIAIFRNRIVQAPEDLIPSDVPYKERLLEAFDDLVKTQIGRYIFEKAHPESSFDVKNIAAAASYNPGSKRVTVSDSCFRGLPLKVPESLAHEVMHSVQHINKMIGAPKKSIREKVTVSRLMELNTELLEVLVQDQMERLPKYRYLPIDNRLNFLREVRDAKMATGADEQTAERFARTKIIEAYWSRRPNSPVRVGNRNILQSPFRTEVGGWNAAYNGIAANILVNERRSAHEAMQDKGIASHVERYIHLMGADVRPSFFKDPEVAALTIPNSTTIIAYENGIKLTEINVLVGTGKVTKTYKTNGQLCFLKLKLKEKRGADGNQSYTEYHDGSRTKRATYTYRNGKMNGIYREYDRQGQQILEVPVENNEPKGNGWFLEKGKRVLKTFNKGFIRNRKPQKTP